MPPWLAPLLVAATALPVFAAFWIGGRPALGALWAAVGVALGLALALGRRSATLRILAGVDDDERTRALEHEASTFALLAVTLALVVLFLAEGVRGGSGLVYGVLLLGVEVVRLAALAALARRR